MIPGEPRPESSVSPGAGHAHGEDDVGDGFWWGGEVGGEPVLQQSDAAGYGEPHAHLRFGRVAGGGLHLFGDGTAAVDQAE